MGLFSGVFLFIEFLGLFSGGLIFGWAYYREITVYIYLLFIVYILPIVVGWQVQKRNLKIIHPGCLIKKWSVLSKILQFSVEIDVFFQYRVQTCTFYEQNFLIKE